MTDTAIRQALEGVTPSRATLAASLASDSALVLDAAGASDIGLDLTDDAYKAIILTDGTGSATIFVYDDSDTTTAHDGVACLVSSDGKRFKAASPVVWERYVKSATTTAPPGSPTTGDVYRVPASPTGDWAAQGNKLAIRKSAGWAYVTPAKGYFHWVEDTTSFEYWDGASWAAGLGSSALGNGDVTPSKLALPFGVSVENATTATPPGSPSTGVAYLIAASPTGAWAGEAGNVARWNGATWDILDAYSGARVYDKAENQPRVFDGANWVLSGAGLVKGYKRAFVAAGTVDTVGRFASTSSNPSLSDFNQTKSALLASISGFTPKSTDNDLLIAIDMSITAVQLTANVSYSIALFRDAQAEPLWVLPFRPYMPDAPWGFGETGLIGSDTEVGRLSTVVLVSPEDLDHDTTSSGDKTEREYRLRVGNNQSGGLDGARTITHGDVLFTIQEVQSG